jgi:hypothetical protein
MQALNFVSQRSIFLRVALNRLAYDLDLDQWPNIPLRVIAKGQGIVAGLWRKS